MGERSGEQLEVFAPLGHSPPGNEPAELLQQGAAAPGSCRDGGARSCRFGAAHDRLRISQRCYGPLLCISIVHEYRCYMLAGAIYRTIAITAGKIIKVDIDTIVLPAFNHCPHFPGFTDGECLHPVLLIILKSPLQG
ncbi:hypothetical protein D3C73_1294310 [compost metagenome]